MHSKSLRSLLALLVTALFPLFLSTAHGAPLRVLISSDNDAFRADYAAALQKGGAQVVAAAVPDAAKLAQADVVVLQNSTFTALPAEAQAALKAFAERGGGIVAVNGGVASGDMAWGKALLGGGWDTAESRKFTSRMTIYTRPDTHPLVSDASPFDVDDETVYDLDLEDEKINVLASAFTPKVNKSPKGDRERDRNKDQRASIYDIQPQFWNFEGAKHRAVVLLPASATATLKHASIRSFILRSVAWAGKRDNVDELCQKADLANLRYPEGGPMRPNDAIKQFELQTGFKASVVVSEPLITKPISVQWDAKGRMWVAETPEYPNGRRPLNAPAWKEGGVLEPGKYDRPARDRISMLEDTNGDGVMDKKTVFFDGLELVTGFCMYGDGVIAVAQPNVVWIRDTDGDGKGDKTVVLFGGFTPGDTHFVPNHFINAPDGWIYASTGGGLTPTKPGSKEPLTKLSPGMFRFKPDGSAIETVGSIGGNSFAAEVTSTFDLFYGQATSGTPVHNVVLPERILAKASGNKVSAMSPINPRRKVERKDMPDRSALMQIDQVGGYSAACSAMVYEGGAWPKEFDNLVFSSEPILDIVHYERLVPKGPTFTGELVLKDVEWLRSRDYWFCPIDITFGPDGAVYVLDFYTPVVAHNDTRGPQHSKSGASVRPDREHYFGRIYRIQHDGAVKMSHPDLTKADAAGLVAAFKHPNRVVRFNALRVLMEKADTLGAQALPSLTTMASGEVFAPARILAIWALQRMGKLTPAVFASAAAAPDAGVRKNAFLAAEAGRMAFGAKELTAALGDSDPKVRLAALRAAGVSPSGAELNAVILASQGQLDDPWSKAAAAAASAGNPSAVLESLLSSKDPSTPQREEFARSLAGSLASNGDGAAVVRVLQGASKSTQPAIAAGVLRELSQSPPKAPADAAASQAALKALLAGPDRTLAGAALPLAASWDSTGQLKADLAKTLGEQLALARDSKQTPEVRGTAIKAVVGARQVSPEVLPAVIALLGQPQPEGFSREVIAALKSTGGDAAAGNALVTAFGSLSGGAKDAAFDALANRPEWSGLLLSAVEAKKVPLSALGAPQMSRLTSHPDPVTAKRAKGIFALLGAGTSPAKDELLAKLTPVVEKPGNPAKGKELFTASCTLCHRLVGQGNVFGPDLDGIGSHSAAELLMHIVDPNRSVDDEHRTWNITMKDGTQYSALIASENDTTVKLRQPGGQGTELKVRDIATRTKVPTSLMPEGLEGLGGESLRDIISYIQSVAPKNGPAKR